MSAKTEVPKKYDFGFVLTEQRFRRIVNCCVEQLRRRSTEVTVGFTVQLRDSSVITTENINDVFLFENGGQKEIIRLTAVFLCATESSMEVSFIDPHSEDGNWTSISSTVKSDDRDWAFLADSELEDKIKRTSFFSLVRKINKYGGVINGFFIVLVIFTYNQWVEPFVTQSEYRAGALQSAYQSGAIHDPIEAMIFLERLRESNRVGKSYYIAYFMALILVPLLFNSGLKWLVRKAYKPYVFCWGDQEIRHQREMRRITFVANVIILGLVLSISGSFLFEAIKSRI